MQFRKAIWEGPLWEIWFLGLILLFFMVIGFHGTDPFTSYVADLGQIPDSVDHLLLAQALTKGTLTLNVDGLPWPSHYPPLMAVILVPFFILFRTPEQVASIAPVVLGMLAIATGYLAIRPLLGAATAILFAALLASSPLFLIDSRWVLTEPSMLTLCFLTLIFITREVRRPAAVNRLAVGALCGLLVLLRTQGFFIIAAAILSVGILYASRRPRHLLEIALPFLLIASLNLLFNAVEYGNPFMTGYEYHFGHTITFFLPRYFGQNLALLHSIVLGEPVYIIGNLWALLALGFPVLAVAGAILIGRRHGWRAPTAAAIFIVLTWAPFLFYSWAEPRLLFVPTTVIYALIAAFFALLLFEPLKRYLGRHGALAVLIAAVFVWPGFGKSSALAYAESIYDWRVTANKYLLAQSVNAEMRRTGRSSVLLTDVYLPLMYAWVGPAIKVYSLIDPACWAKCRAWGKREFKPDIDQLYKSQLVYFTDIFVKHARFEHFCRELAKRYTVTPIPTLSQYRLFLLKDHTATDSSANCR